MKRRIVTGLSLLVVAALVLAGCGTGKAASVDPDRVAQASIDPQKTYTLKLWNYPHFKEYEDFLKQQLAEFQQQHPNIKVEHEILTWAEGAQKIQVASQAGDLPDVLFSVIDPTLINSGFAVPVDPFLTGADRADIDPAAMKVGTYMGKTYLWPMWISVQSWGGNRALLEEAGVDWRKIQQDGWTWEEFHAAAAKLTRPDNGFGKKQYGFVTYGNSEVISHLMRNNGLIGSLTPAGQFNWTGPGALAAAKFLRSLVDGGITPRETAGIDSKKMSDMWRNWEAALFGRVGPYIISEEAARAQQAKEGKLQLHPRGVVDPVLLPYPHAAGSKEVPTVGGAGLMVLTQKKYKGDDHTRAAVELARFLTNKEGGYPAAWMKIIPARKSAQEHGPFRDMIGLNTENGRFLLRNLPLAVDRIDLPQELNEKDGKITAQVIKPLAQAFWAGEITPEQFIEQMTLKARAILDE